MESKSNKNNLVSVIMNCFNSEKYIELSIKSVLEQTYTNWELIIWDNCSTDNTSKVVEKFNDKRILYFSANKHTSLGFARNEALKRTNGKFISFIDSDDIWLSKKLEIQINFIEKNKEINFVYSNHYVIDENGKRVFRFDLWKKPIGKIFHSILRRNNTYILTVLFESSFIKLESNLFDTNLELIEELEFFTRLLRKYNAGYIATPLAEYRVHPNMTTKLKYSKLPDEIDYLVRKLRRNCSPQDRETLSSIRYLECKNIYYRANLLMKSGKRSAASKLLYKIKFYSITFLLLYFLSLFNYRIWINFHRLMNRF
tara:strand:+ start:89 stop:1027 length:939 start_codon:yes stop_codon:yes gene_type:complete